MPKSEPSQETAEVPSGILQQLEVVQRELRRLSAIVALANDRLATLERQHGIAVPSPELGPAPQPQPAAEVSAEMVTPSLVTSPSAEAMYPQPSAPTPPAPEV